MRNFISLIALSLLLILVMSACDVAKLPTLTSTPSATAALITTTAIITTNSATPAIPVPDTTQTITTIAVTTAVPTVKLPEIETSLGPLPTNCPVSQLTYKELDSSFGKATGGPGLWAVGLQNKIQINPDQLPHQITQLYGWGIKILWVVDPAQKEPIALSGYNRADNQPVWFAGLSNNYSTAPIFPTNPSSSSYGTYPSNVFFAKAGCYDFVAKWNGGSWKITFAVGRQ